jgi:hypothetical protein
MPGRLGGVAAHARFGQQRWNQARRTSVAPPIPRGAYRPRSDRRRESQDGDRPVWPQGPTTLLSAPYIPRPIANARMGKPSSPARTFTLTHRSTRSDGDLEGTHGRSPVWPQRPTTPGPLAVSRERSRRHAWAKPCLAGRPTMLVRTQLPEKNTSRGRPSGMELPDYPVMATLPTPWDQDGPALPLPAGSFPRFVARSASRRSTFPVLVPRSSSRRPF